MPTDTLASVCIWILQFLGWNTEVKFPKFNDREIWIFPHESCWDFILFGLYKFSFPDDLNMYTIVKPQMFEGPLRFLVTKLGCIPATRLEDKGKGFVSSTAQFVKNKESFKILISPKGTIYKAPWRSGYYYLAKETNSKIRVVGLDYRRHNVVFRQCHDLKSSKDTLEEELKLDVSSIPQLTPTSLTTSATDPPLWARFLIVIVGLIVIYLLLCAVFNLIRFVNRRI